MLIGTKLCIPPLKGKMLHRKHLADRLSQGRDCRLISVCGPAASGKTSLVCEWIKRDGLTAAWYSLDETDNDRDTFFEYLFAALAKTGCLTSPAVGHASQGRRRPSARDIVSHLVAQARMLKDDVYLCLDDYHLISAQDIHDALSLLITHMPARMHLVVSSRYGLPFSSSRWKIKNEMLEISSQDMKWSARETDRFFREVLGIHLSPGQSEQLTLNMEGWVGGLQLFALSLRGKRAVTSLTAILGKACREAADYLINEVLNAQSERVRMFVLKTALLDRFNAEVCRVVTDMEDAPAILAHVFQNSLFLNSLDEEETWFRYHNILSKAVRKEPGMVRGAIRREVCCKAARWFAKNGYLEDAFRQAFASGDMDFAADLLEDYLSVLYEQDEIAAFRRWLNRVPREVLARYPLLRLLECRFKMETVQLSDISATLDDIESRQADTLAQYEGSKRQLCDDLLLLLKYILPYWFDPENMDVEKVSRLLDRASPKNKTLSGINVLIPFGHFYRGEMAAAGRILEETAKIVFTAGTRLDQAIWFRVVAMVERFQGRLRRSEAVLAEAIPYVTGGGVQTGGPLAFMINLPLAWVLFLRNRVDDALECGSAALKQIEQTRFLYELLDVNYLLSLVYQARGEADKANRCARKMLQTARMVGAPGMTGLAEAYMIRTSLCGNDVDRARAWASDHPFRADDPFSFRFAVTSLAHAEIALRLGNHREALGMLVVIRERCLDHNMMEAVLEADILMALSTYALKDLRGAKAVIGRALRFSESEGYVRPFVDKAELITPLLSETLISASRTTESSYIAAIAKACVVSLNDQAQPRRSTGREESSLTQREKETLDLMDKGLRDKEIAEALFVSVATVKTHVHHILEKLNVRTRVQAIRRAKEQRIQP